MQKNENLKAAADTNANKKPSPKRENKNPDDVKAGKAQNQQQRKPMKAEEKKSSPKETTASEKNEPKTERKSEKQFSIVTVTKLIFITNPSAPYLGNSIQSPIRTIS